MLIISLEVLLIFFTIILFLIKGVSILTIALVLVIILIPVGICISNRRSAKNEKEQAAKRFMNYLNRQMGDTLTKRIAMELERAKAESNKKKILLEGISSKKKNAHFDEDTSIVNGETMHIELRLCGSRLNNESSKDRLDKNVL